MNTILRNERIDNLIKAQHTLLYYIRSKKGTIKASEGRFIASSLVAKQSRRDSVWSTMINAGFLQPIGKGVYRITSTGTLVCKYWTRWFGKPDTIVRP